MTEVSLREYLESKFASHEREHELLAEALSLNNAMVKEWREAANEWRGTLTDLTGRFATRESVEQLEKAEDQRIDNAVALMQGLHKSDADRLDVIERANIRAATQTEERHAEALKALEKQRSEATRQQWVIGVGVSILAIVVSIMSRIVFQ